MGSSGSQQEAETKYAKTVQFHRDEEFPLEGKEHTKSAKLVFDTNRAKIDQRREEVGPEAIDNYDFERELDKMYEA